MWAYFTNQMTRLEEFLWGAGLLILGLFLEDWIDRYRARKAQAICPRCGQPMTGRLWAGGESTPVCTTCWSAP